MIARRSASTENSRRRLAAAALTAVTAAAALAACAREHHAGADFSALLHGRRPIEARLAGAFPWAPCSPTPDRDGRPAAARCSDPPAAAPIEPRVLIPASRSTRGAPAGNAAESLHRRALRDLLLRGSETAAADAVAALTAAIAARPGEAALRNDLGTAYYERAMREREPRYLLSSYGAAAAALEIDPRLPAARFNRALVLERLHLAAQAERAWSEYLELDADQASGWAREARQRRDRLRLASRPAASSNAGSALLRAAREASDAGLLALVSANRQAARELVLEDLLGQWGDEMVRHGRPLAAAVVPAGGDALRMARRIARSLAAAHGDGSAADAVAAIDRAAADPGGGERRRALALGHRAYRAGSAALRRSTPEAAARQLKRAARLLARGGSRVAAAWAAAGLAGAHAYRSDYAAADNLFRSLLRGVDGQRFPALRGRLAWGLGWSRGRQGSLGVAYEQYQAAARAFELAGEAANLGNMQLRLAEALSLLGEQKQAWRYRFAALADPAFTADGTRFHHLLLDAATAAQEDGEPAAALVLAKEDVAVTRRGDDPQELAEALVARGKIWLASQRTGEARADLEAARQASERGNPAAVHDQLEIDLETLQGETLRRADAAAALPFFTRSLETYRRRGLPLALALAHSGRARAEIDLRRDREAEADLAAAAALVNGQTEAIEQREFRVSFAETLQQIFDELILLRVKTGGAAAALAAAEWARNLSIMPDDFGSPAAGQRQPRSTGSGRAARAAAAAPSAPALAEVPAGVTILEYALAGDTLLCWTIRRGGLAMSQSEIHTRRLESLVDAVERNLRGEGSEREARTAAESLYRLLIPPALRGSTETLAIVPDRMLNRLPFAALRDPESGRYLIEQHPLSLALSAGRYLAALRRPRLSGAGLARALLVGNPKVDRRLAGWLPDLPAAGTEVRAIEDLYPAAALLTGAEATAERVLRELPRSQVFHYAGHAVSNPADPGLSYLLLAPSGAAGGSGELFVRRLEGLRLPELRLVVLSACSTIEAMPRRNGGLAGLARPFLDAGAAAVVGSLWTVEDQAANRLLIDFHRRLRTGQRASAAMRGAQLDALRGPDPALRSSNSWAAFELIGEL